jgi:protein-tyrosine phosphatase
MKSNDELRILIVCLGNICRSPMAEGALSYKLAAAGLDADVVVDSAGTADLQIGKMPDPRARSAAGARGYEIGASRARQVEPVDFDLFDWVLACDRQNLADLWAAAPADRQDRLRLLLEFGPGPEQDVPDPFQGEMADFHRALDVMEPALDGLVASIRAGETAHRASA